MNIIEAIVRAIIEGLVKVGAELIDLIISVLIGVGVAVVASLLIIFWLMYRSRK